MTIVIMKTQSGSTNKPGKSVTEGAGECMTLKEPIPMILL